LPPPAILQGYGQVLPDAPERILKMAENEARHRQALVKGEVFRATWGVVCAFLLGVLRWV
jgi:uncharacterized membrane protein